MSLFSIGPLVVSFLTLFFGVFVYLKNKDLKLNRLFCLLCVCVFIWAFGYSQMYNTKDNALFALSWARLGYCGVIFIPVLVWHYTVTFLELRRRKFTKFCVYLISFFFLSISQTDFFLHSMFSNYFWGYYPKAGPLYIYFVLFFACIFVRMVFLLYKALRLNKQNLLPAQVNRIKYLLFGFGIATTSIIDYVQNYGFEIYPWGYLSALGWLICMGWATFRYRLMDIKVVLTRAGIFIVVYTAVIGVPFWIGFKFLGKGLWIIPVSVTALLATLGPFIYLFIDRKAEENLLKEQRRYQDTLKQASAGMTRVRNLKKLLELITHIITRTVKISYVSIYLYDQETKDYKLQVSRNKNRISVMKIETVNPLVNWITKNQEPLIYEELKRKAQDSSGIYKDLEENMQLLGATVIIPSFLEDRLVGFFVLGEKLTGQIYTPEDLNVFQILASQAALAIENAQFYEDTKQMQEQVAQAEKMATIGTMADGLSHQINNRFHALSLITGDTIDTIKLTDTSKCTPEVQEMVSQINHALQRIKENVKQGGEVVKGILKYTRKGDDGFEALTLDQVLDGALDMVQYKIKLSEIDVLRDYAKDSPKIKGNLVQLQEAFFNFIDNAYDAAMERRDLLREEKYRGKIIISTQAQMDGKLRITVQDNGIGMKENWQNKVFAPFFTTKTSSHKGTGLGLYVIKRIIEENNQGKISFASEYGKGTTFFVELPLA
ncbi:MAG: ATP-binding protein [Candidatus Omnitrophica bacterium]|nr:ATP-binding protein [Candidatus Omnitrophota bacterium]